MYVTEISNGIDGHRPRRESTLLPKWLIDIRTLAHDGIKLIRKARDDDEDVSGRSLVDACKVFKQNIEKSIELINKDIVADDNEKLSAAHKETNVVLGQVCESLLKVLSDSNKLEDASYVRSRVKPALVSAPGRRVLDVLHRTFSTGESYGEPDCALKLGKFEIFPGISHRPAIAESQKCFTNASVVYFDPHVCRRS